jgi:hypothetical protein
VTKTKPKSQAPEVCPDCGKVHDDDKIGEVVDLAYDFVDHMILPAVDGYEDRMGLPPYLLDDTLFRVTVLRMLQGGRPITSLVAAIDQLAETVAADMDLETPHAPPERPQ